MTISPSEAALEAARRRLHRDLRLHFAERPADLEKLLVDLILRPELETDAAKIETKRRGDGVLHVLRELGWRGRHE